MKLLENSASSPPRHTRTMTSSDAPNLKLRLPAGSSGHRPDYRIIIYLLVLTTLILSGATASWFVVPLCIFLLWRWSTLLNLSSTLYGAQIPDEYTNKHGSCLFLVGLMTTLFLRELKQYRQTWPTNKSLFRACLFLDLLVDGSAEERQQAGLWASEAMSGLGGSPGSSRDNALDTEHLGYTAAVKAKAILIIQYTVITFQERYGHRLTPCAKEEIVMQYSCIGRRLGISEHLLAHNYEALCSMFQSGILGSEVCKGGAVDVNNILNSVSWSPIMTPVISALCLLGHDLLPPDAQKRYALTPLQKFLQKALSYLLWTVYPLLPWVPLRGQIIFSLIFVPGTDAILRDLIQRARPLQPDSNIDTVNWLQNRAKDSIFQQLLVTVFEWQNTKSGVASLISNLTQALIKHQIDYFSGVLTSRKIDRRRIQVQSCASKLPAHVGIIMDGNRRYARQRGQETVYGHRLGAALVQSLIQWWTSDSPSLSGSPLPKVITLWALSTENLGRSAAELHGLLNVLSAELLNIAFNPLVHRFRIKVKVIGEHRERLPRALLDSIELLESATELYGDLSLHIAIGYRGRGEVVNSVNHFIAQTPGVSITETDIGMGTYCESLGVPPVNLIIRTSERRTSGFFLWDTQNAELHFMDKLWPEVTELDWLDALLDYAQREQRGGR